MNHFEKEIPKTLSYTMVDKFDDYFEQLVKEMQHIETDRQLDEHMQLVKSEGNLYSFFNIIKKEFNEYVNCDIDFEFETWYNKNNLEFRQYENQIFMSTSAIIPMFCYYAFILYQADNLDNEDEKKMCFSNLFGIISEACLWDCDQVAIDAFKLVFEKIRNSGNYVSLANVLMNTSIAFAWLHEMAHNYLKHDIATSSIQSQTVELEADQLAYEIFLSIIDKNKRAKFNGGVFSSCFQEYAYLSPAMFIGFIQAVKITDKILYNKDLDASIFDIMIARKNKIIDYIEMSDIEIDTKDGNDLYGGYERSLDSFANGLVTREQAGILEKYKNGGWELSSTKNVLKRKYSNEGGQAFINIVSDAICIERAPISQSIAGIVVPRTGSLSGHSLKISNIKFKLSEILSSALIFSLQFASSGGPLAYMLIFVEMISMLYNKAKKPLSETDCVILLTLKQAIDNGYSQISEEKLKALVMQEHPELSGIDIQKSISKLHHIDCIDITNELVTLKEIVNVRYDF